MNRICLFTVAAWFSWMPAFHANAQEVASNDPIADALQPTANGLTPDQVAKLAVANRASVKTKKEELRAAAAKVDQAFINYIPKLTLSATYTRLSETSSSFGGGGALVGAQNEGPILVGFCTTGSLLLCAVDSTGAPIGAQAISFDSQPNSYALAASLIVPVSDYVLRITQGYMSASHNENAKKHELQAESRQSAADAKVAFFSWLRALGQLATAKEAVKQSKAHLEDARRTFEVGLLSKADVLRMEAQVASSEQLQTEAEAMASLSAIQLQTITGLDPNKPLENGFNVYDENIGPPAESLAQYQNDGFVKRPELLALTESAAMLQEIESVSKAGYFPRLDAFGDLNYANPNARIFPQQDQWDATWDVGARLSWTVNDTFTALGASTESNANTRAVVRRMGTLRDGIRLEVAAAYTEAKKAKSSLEAANRGLIAAVESLRVRTELFRNGKATSVDLIDAETEVTRARLRKLDAQVGLFVARVRLDRASGRDAL